MISTSQYFQKFCLGCHCLTVWVFHQQFLLLDLLGLLLCVLAGHLKIHIHFIEYKWISKYHSPPPPPSPNQKKTKWKLVRLVHTCKFWGFNRFSADIWLMIGLLTGVLVVWDLCIEDPFWFLVELVHGWSSFPRPSSGMKEVDKASNPISGHMHVLNVYAFYTLSKAESLPERDGLYLRREAAESPTFWVENLPCSDLWFLEGYESAEFSTLLFVDEMWTASWYRSCLKCTTCSSSRTTSSSKTATSARSSNVYTSENPSLKNTISHWKIWKYSVKLFAFSVLYLKIYQFNSIISLTTFLNYNYCHYKLRI